MNLFKSDKRIINIHHQNGEYIVILFSRNKQRLKVYKNKTLLYLSLVFHGYSDNEISACLKEDNMREQLTYNKRMKGFKPDGR